MSEALPTRTFEDLAVGERRRSSDLTVTEAEILKFARDYDPQWFHADPEAARKSAFGGLIASGLHTAALWRRLDHEINGDIAFVCGIGWDEARWPNPVRAGDTIRVESEIVSLRPSTGRDDRGVGVFRYRVRNQDGLDVLTFSSINLIYTRAGLAGSG